MALLRLTVLYLKIVSPMKKAYAHRTYAKASIARGSFVGHFFAQRGEKMTTEE
jgi:hypothetical protein